VQRHFSRYLRQRLHQKVRRTHPHLQHGERMLDGFAAHTHGWWVLIEPRLRGLDDVFVFPALDTALVRRCALILERACAARLRQVNPHFVTIFISGEVVRQLLHLALFDPAGWGSGYLATAANVEHVVERRVLPVGWTVRIRQVFFRRRLTDARLEMCPGCYLQRWWWFRGHRWERGRNWRTTRQHRGSHVRLWQRCHPGTVAYAAGIDRRVV
jgi:hypothetical protein